MTPKLTQLANLIKLAKVDGKLEQEEIMLIYGIAQRNNVSKFELDEIIERVDSIETSAPSEPAEAIRFLYQLMVMAAIDFEVSEGETALLHKVGAELGLEAGKVDKAVDYLVKNQKTDLNDDQVSALFA